VKVGMGARGRSGREAALEHALGLGLGSGLGLAHLSMTRALEAERRMTKRRVERSERYCVMRSSTSIIAMAKTTLEIAMTLTWVRVASCVHEATAWACGTAQPGCWGLRPGYVGTTASVHGVTTRGTYGFSDGGYAPRA
jgi:hypothetical protein